MSFCIFFFFNDTATTDIYTLSLHDALPIFLENFMVAFRPVGPAPRFLPPLIPAVNYDIGGVTVSTIQIVIIVVSADRKSTRLNSSHSSISYAVFCLKKKKKNK